MVLPRVEVRKDGERICESGRYCDVNTKFPALHHGALNLRLGELSGCVQGMRLCAKPSTWRDHGR